MEDLKDVLQKHYEKIVKLRHFLHENPEIGFEEVKTSQAVCKMLDDHGISYKKGIAKTGILAQIKGNKQSKNPKCVLLRADMDALVIQEEADVPYKSKIPNRMHACGHDGHTAGLVGAALVLNDLKDEFSGVVKFMFQPAEETSGGALPMIKEGILENPKVDASFGCHLWGQFVENHIGISKGAIFAAPDEVHITLKGKGGHGSRPDQSINPIVMAGYVITNLQSIVTSRISPLENVTLSLGSIEGGNIFNVIPNEVKIKGTVRTLNEEVRDKMPSFIEDVLKGVSLAHGGSYELDYSRRYPVLINDEKMALLAKKAFGKALGEECVHELEEPIMGGEDFSYLAKEVPSCFVLVGISKDMENRAIHHNSCFAWDDKNMKNLSLGLASCALEFLRP